MMLTVICFSLKILADSMGLGKTIMTISLLLANSERDSSSSSKFSSQPLSQDGEANGTLNQLTRPLEKASNLSGFDNLMKQNKNHKIVVNGGNLIICPMTLLGQWKVFVLPFCYILWLVFVRLTLSPFYSIRILGVSSHI